MQYDESIKKENGKMKEDSTKDDVDEKPTGKKDPLGLASGVKSSKIHHPFAQGC
jgi:hypothetical protein